MMDPITTWTLRFVRAIAPLFTGLLLATGSTVARAEPRSMDSLVQAPELKAPERGSLAGAYSATAFGPGDLTRGTFGVPSGMAVPQDRGPLLVNVFPTYSPENPIGEWGMGWSSSLAIVRSSVVGDIRYDQDELSSPYGRLARGDDGYLYPLGLSTAARLEKLEDRIVAYLPDGSRQVFGGENRIVTAQGTYAWYLSEVVTKVGRKTRLCYTRNGSGRLFVSRVEYGGSGDSFEHRIDYEYEPIARPFEDLRPGQALLLDQRVKRVTVLSRATDSGSFAERWRYELSYRSEGLPAFYLAGLQQIFRSGERAPAIAFEYHLGLDALAASRFARDASLSTALVRLGHDGFQPDRSAFLDEDEDGLVDIEASRDYALYVRTEAGFAVRELPPPPPDVFPGCRRVPSPDNAARTLVQLLGSQAYYVVNIEATPDRLASRIDVCNREGQRLWTQPLVGDWELSPTVRLADLDRDRRPELIRVSAGRYQVLPNTSASGTVSYGPVQDGSLEPSFVPDTVWVHDFNGDSIPDLIARYPGGLIVWSGKGRLAFEPRGHRVEFWSNAGPLASIQGYDLTFLDGNNDGLADVVLTSPTHNAAFFFINEGRPPGDDRPIVFREVAVPGLRQVDPYMSRPMAVDLAGTGDTTLVYTRGTEGFTVVLAGPETGLLKSADDGRGTVLHFHYAHARPEPGERTRPSVLDRLTVESSGYEPVSYDYRYGEPRLHSEGRFLLGFNRVTRANLLGEDTLDFINDDRYTGVLVGGIHRDALVPAVLKWEKRDYEDASFHGIAWKRLHEESTGWRSTGRDAVEGDSERTVYRDYDAELCPSRTETTNRSGTLITTTEYAHLPGFARHLSCLTTAIVQEGVHQDHELDFRHEQRLARNNVGLVIRVDSVADGKTLNLQTIDYDSKWRITSLQQPGSGVTRLTWEGRTNLLRAIVAPDRSAVSVTRRDPTSDAILSLATAHGRLVRRQFFRFDGQERLDAAWDDVGSGSERDPDSTYAYRYATALQPGAVVNSTLVDAVSGSRRESIEFYTAAGEPIGTATRQAITWSFGDLVRRSRATGKVTHYLRPALPAVTDPRSLGYSALFDGTSTADAAWPVTMETRGGFGITTQSIAVVQDGVRRTMGETVEISPAGEFVRRLRENDRLETVTTTDAAGRLWSFRDQTGEIYRYTYDVLGRLRRIVLPDGKRQVIRLDGYGRTSRVERTEIGSIAYAYSDQTGLLVAKTYISTTGALQRKRALTYDAAGRVIEEKYQATSGGAIRRYRYLWDGATLSAPGQRTVYGLLTGVLGDSYAKELSYAPDGKLATSRLSIATWRQIETSFRYSDAGDLVERRTTVSAAGAGARVLDSAVEQNLLDRYGRIAQVLHNGAPTAVLGYDNNGLPAEARLGDTAIVTLTYEPRTRRQTGIALHTSNFDAEVARTFNDRALPAADELSVGALRFHRAYSYSPQGFLVAARDERHAYGYRYDAIGIPLAIVTDGTVRELARTGAVVTAGPIEYRLDDLGRVVQRGDLAFSYGPDGQLATARRGSTEWTFAYDEHGKRLLKRTLGTPVAAYLEEGYLDDSGLTETYHFAGNPVALLHGTNTVALATDFLGTVIADYGGEPRIASPFGERDRRPASSAIVDFAAKGFDADLGLVRMGVRDYDPFIAQWSTPDPMFLDDPSAGVERPLELNLRSYAMSSPLALADPTGTSGIPGRPVVPASVAPWLMIGALLSDLRDAVRGLYVFGGVEAKAEGRTLTVGSERVGMFGIDRAKGPWLGSLDAAGGSLGEFPSVLQGNETIYYFRDGSLEQEHLMLMEHSLLGLVDKPMLGADVGAGVWQNLERPTQLGTYLFTGPSLKLGMLEFGSFVGIGIEAHLEFPNSKPAFDLLVR